MIDPKRIRLVLAIILVSSLFAFLALTYNNGGTEASGKVFKSKILRRYDRKKEKPNAKELDMLRRNAQEEDGPKERVLEDKIPKHVPITIKIRTEKEKAFKDLNNPKWHRDFELEVTNTSSKPIYFLRLIFLMPEVISGSGRPVGFPLLYGRTDFIDFDTRPTPSDVPIQPGATYVFRILDEDLRGWEAHRAKEHRSDPKKIELIFAQLAFGDGTGFNGTDAKAYPYKREQSTGPCREGPLPPRATGGASEPSMGFAAALRRDWFAKKTGSGLAGFFSALGSVFLGSVPADPQSGLCCPSSACYRERNASYNCSCRSGLGTQTTSCSDPQGSCSIHLGVSRWCDDLGVDCPQDVVGPCEDAPPPASPTPTVSPTPSPTPSPSPSPACDLATKPNNTNCECITSGVSVGIAPYWYCFCQAGTRADYHSFPGTPGYGGCDNNKYNNGSDSCLCINTTCPAGGTPDQFTCQCPTPTPGGGGTPNTGTYRQDCVDYYWVWLVSYDGGQTWYIYDEQYAGCYSFIEG